MTEDELMPESGASTSPDSEGSSPLPPAQSMVSDEIPAAPPLPDSSGGRNTTPVVIAIAFTLIFIALIVSIIFMLVFISFGIFG